jgi:predicted aspartyl protease
MAARTPGNVRRPIVPIIVTVEDRSIETYALLDTGANCDAIVPFLVRELNRA